MSLVERHALRRIIPRIANGIVQLLGFSASDVIANDTGPERTGHTSFAGSCHEPTRENPVPRQGSHNGGREGGASRTVERRLSSRFKTFQNEPPAKIIIDSPLAEPLSRGVVFIQHRTENLHLVPVFGLAALEPVIMMGLAPGRHKILIQRVNANHRPIDQGTVQVTAPAAEAHQRSEFSL